MSEIVQKIMIPGEVANNGRILIPSPIRKLLGWTDSTSVIIIADTNGIITITKNDSFPSAVPPEQKTQIGDDSE